MPTCTGISSEPRSHRTTRRVKHPVRLSALADGRQLAERLFREGRRLEGCDVYEALYVQFPHHAVDLLAELYDRYQSLSDTNSRYDLYQARLFDFHIGPADRVLDIGSGNDPFPLATHVADIALEDDQYGRAGAPFKRPVGKQVLSCNLEDMRGFRDKEFDFIYCSHVLEHVNDPAAACREIIRVGKRGFIETPTRGKDLWLNTAAVSHHRWAVERVLNRLVFSEYEPDEINGLQCDLLLTMHMAPESVREKALTALLYLKADLFNTMMAWEDTFSFEVRRVDARRSGGGRGWTDVRGIKTEEAPPAAVTETVRTHQPWNATAVPKTIGESDQPSQIAAKTPAKSCLFLNTYYPRFLEGHYQRHHDLAHASYETQHRSLQAACFGDSDFYSTGLQRAGWNAADVIVNCVPLQRRWAEEHGFDPASAPVDVVVAQLRDARAQVLYLQDLGMATQEFIAAVRPHVDLIIGQIASPIPPQTYLDGFDLLLSSFPHFVDTFRRQGRTAYYQPLAFDPRVLQQVGQPARDYPLTFVGGLSPAHRERHQLLTKLGTALPLQYWGYGTTELAHHGIGAERLHGDVWGLDMFAVLARSSVTLNHHIDVAKSNANNMRLFEATGCGALLVTDYKDNLADLFEIGSEVVAYRSLEECEELVAYYLHHPDEGTVIAKRGQARTLRDHTYGARMKQTADILARHWELKTGRNRLPDPDLGRVSYAHRQIASHEVTTELAQSWCSDEIPRKQRALVQRELAELYSGRPPKVFQVLADALQPHVRPDIGLLEVGCASGYYYEVLEYLLKTTLSYVGVDFSSAMIRLARAYYSQARFEVGDGAALRFDDNGYPIVVSSGVLLHVQNYAAHIAEAARVASGVVVLHRTPMYRTAATAYFKKLAYGVETFELRFNEGELFELCAHAGLECEARVEYDRQEGRDEFDATYVFRKAVHAA